MTLGPVGQTITAKLRDAFAPVHLDVIDESHHHAGHSGARSDGESHFRVKIVAEAFRNKSRVDQHRMVNAILAEELRERVHALAIQASAPAGDASLSFQPVAPDDPAMIALLAAARLPVDDLAGKAFLGIADQNGTLLACGGLEGCGDAVLIRSIAVLPERQKSGIGSAITLKLLAEARNAGATACYLLTNTAAPFFERLGFQRIARSDVPAAVAATGQFTGTACASAQPMVQSLNQILKG